jgi:hypothetical protein
MTSRLFCASAAAALAGSAVASVTVTNNQSLWDWQVTSGGQVVATETFADFDGFYPTGASGSVAGVSWTASASGGVYADTGLMTSNFGSTALVFNFAPGLQGVAGNFFGTDFDFNFVNSVVQVTLSDGTSYLGFSNSPTDFIGFYSATASISSLSISATGVGSGDVFATADNLYFAVPAPGAIALLGVAGLVSRRRR